MLRHPARFENAWPFHISSASLFFVEIVYSQATKKCIAIFLCISIAINGDFGTRHSGVGKGCGISEGKEVLEVPRPPTWSYLYSCSHRDLGCNRSQINGIFEELGCRIRAVTDEPKSADYLLQRISVAVQRGNSIAVQGSTGA